MTYERPPQSKSIFGAKWVYRNKLHEQGKVVRHKAKLVAKGYSHQKGVDYTETYAPITKLEVICILLSFDACRNIKLHQMNIKSVSL